MTDEQGVRLWVARADLHSVRIVPDPDAPAARPLAEGEARLRIHRFALTANNITYAAFGEALHYWDFFPTGDSAWGCIPVWGFAEVAESRAPGLGVGERYYGYWPMGRWLVLRPERIGPRGFVAGDAHRGALPAVYNQAVRCDADPSYVAAQEAEQALLKPLFTTSFLIDDFLAEEGFFGATQVLLSSASSKTGFATAFCMKRAPGSGPLSRPAPQGGASSPAEPDLLRRRRGTASAVRVLGCSSPRNLDFCRSLGVYDQLLAYDAIGTLDPQQRTVYVDFAGDADFRRRVHEHFRDALAYSCSVGGTHWQALGGGRELPGPKPALFFAPSHIARRSAAPPEGWGAALLGQRIGEAWSAFLQRVGAADPPWLQVRDFVGPQAAREALAAMVEGRADPREGWMLSV